MKAGSTILVIGASGAMGTQVIKSLLKDNNNNWKIKALTRYPRNYRARSLSELDGRIQLVEGDLNEKDSLKDALEGVQGVFCNTDYWSSGKEVEVRQGIVLTEMCKFRDIDHLVYCSLDNCSKISNNKYPVEQYDGKAQVQEFILNKQKAGDFWFKKNVTILQPVSYMENFMTYFHPHFESGQFVFELPLKDKKIPLISLEDIGWFVAKIFATQSYRGKVIPIGSEALSLEEIAQQFNEMTGQHAIPHDISLEDYIKKVGVDGNDLAQFFTFLQEVGIERNYEQIRSVHPEMLSFKKWLARTGWHGESREIQKDFAQRNH